MRLNFYDTRLSEDGRTVLVKEKGGNISWTVWSLLAAL